MEDKDIEHLEKFVMQSSYDLRDYMDANPIRPFSGGKTKYREYREMVEQLDALVDKTEQSFQVKPSCRKGCSACCNHLVTITQFDAEMIWNYIDMTYDREKVKEIKDKVSSAADRLDREFGLPPTLPFEIQNFLNNEQLHKTKYFSLNLACPFLDEEKGCMVYPVRPSACWNYRVYGDPADCSSSYHVPHAANFGHEKYFGLKKQISVQRGNLPKYPAYQAAAPIPQKMREFMKK